MAEHVWGNEFDPFSMSNFVDVHIKNLRKKITANGGKNAAIIRTIRGIGFIIDDAP
jgi:DNA-binding response OmpR family regulator